MSFENHEVFNKSSVVGRDGNGLPLTHRGSSPYYGVAKFEWGGQSCWEAAVTIPQGMSHLMPNNSTSVQLGLYDDPRDAAYVAMMFLENLTENFRDFCDHNLLRKWGEFSGFRPGSVQWEQEALVSSNHQVRARGERVVRRPRFPSGIGESFIRGAFKSGLFGDFTLMDLKSYGRDLVLREMKVLSVEEFGLRFGLI